MGPDLCCQFSFQNGTFCQEPREASLRFCFFHDPGIPKNTPQAREKIIEAIHAKKLLDGAHLEKADLSRADLAGARLVKAHLDGASFERSNLEGAHLYGADLRNANLFNANLRRANLKEVHLEGADILEIKIDETKILGIHWGKGDVIANEKQGYDCLKKRDFTKAREKFREAEEIYRNIRTHLMAQGIFDEAADFFYREQVVRRKQLPFFSIDRISSKTIDLLCGYGEKTFRVMLVAVFFILANACAYFLLGIQFGSDLLKYVPGHSFSENLKTFLNGVYFSVVTFTTVGYGDLRPVGFSRLFAMGEAFFGAFMIALFVVVFTRKMIR